jgi:chemotaxis signal transduction protein
MTGTNSCVEAVIDTMQVALPLQDVERVIRAVAVNPAPLQAGCLIGTIDIRGELVPLYDLRKLLGAAPRGLPLHLSDRIVLLRSPHRCGLVVDAVPGTVEAGTLELSDEFSLQAAGLRGVARTADGVLLVQDLRRLLAFERAVPMFAHA